MKIRCAKKVPLSPGQRVEWISDLPWTGAACQCVPYATMSSAPIRTQEIQADEVTEKNAGKSLGLR